MVQGPYARGNTGEERIRVSKYHWQLQAEKTKIIADSSEGYKDKSDCRHDIELVKKIAPTVSISATR